MIISVEDIGKYKVESSGSIFSFNQEPIKIKISGDEHDNDPLHMHFIFLNDKNSQEPEIDTRIDGSDLYLNLINYDNPLGTGTSQPVPLGNIGFRKIFINFRVLGTNSNKERLLFYTVYSSDNTEELIKSATKPVANKSNRKNSSSKKVK